ncbi:MAG: dihydrodipicolinate reductase [Sphingomonadales bacterium]|nr:dihydrodipicolinate reductase [Sphingomonadales bacterium]
MNPIRPNPLRPNPLRVAQWGTGNVGLRSLAAIIEHPQMELVAARVFTAAKAGQDTGTLCGKPATGIPATLGIEPILAARPDAVAYMPNYANLDDMCRLLAAGINLVTGCLGFNHRGTMPPADLARIEAACATGQSSLYATGSSPGWITELVPLALLNMQRRLDRFIITDYADNATRNSPEMLIDLLGFGTDPASRPPGKAPGTATSTPPTFHALAEAIGLPLDQITTTTEYAVATKPVDIAVGRIEAGTIGAIRMAISGWHQGREILTRHSLWYVTRDTEPAWDYRDSGWRVQVKGDTSLDISIAFDVEPEAYAAYTPGLTAHPIINALPYVCAAPPGLIQTSELPMLAPYLGA